MTNQVWFPLQSSRTMHSSRTNIRRRHGSIAGGVTGTVEARFADSTVKRTGCGIVASGTYQRCHCAGNRAIMALCAVYAIS